MSPEVVLTEALTHGSHLWASTGLARLVVKACEIKKISSRDRDDSDAIVGEFHEEIWLMEGSSCRR